MRKDMGWLEKRLEELRRIEGYSAGEYSYPTRAAKAEDRRLVKLDANENFFIPQQFSSQIFRELERNLDLRLYPQSEKMELINALSEYVELPSESFTLGNGSDELIETIVRTFLRGSERSISVSPTFSMYRIIVEAHGNTYDAMPLRANFSLDADALLSKVTAKTVLCILCSPNNPTGNQFEYGSVRKILREFKGVVVVDEAYVEFAPSSIKGAIKEFDNLIVLRTFSKAFGLAGLRIGYALASPEITSVLRQIQLPYNVNKFSMWMASKVLEKRKIFLDAVEEVKAERGRLTRRLNEIPGIKAFNSDANFVLVKTEKDAEAIFNELRTEGILVRNIGEISNLGRCLRITVGLPEMNDCLINALEAICNE